MGREDEVLNRVFVQLFSEFFQIGLFAVGGGPATIPFLMELPEQYDWYTKADVASMLAVSESTPGSLGINMATYAGYHAAGYFGGIWATLSLVLPSMIVIILVAKMLDSFHKNPYVKAAFWAIRPLVTGLIAAAVLGILETTLFTAKDGGYPFPIVSIVLCALFFVGMNWKKMKKVHPVFWLLIGAVLGVIFQL